MANQLYIKEHSDKKNIFPKNYTDNIRDKESNKTLTEILQGFNCYFLSYTGNVETTRLQVPKLLRKQGLWITYVDYEDNTITEYYDNPSIEDSKFKDSSNWREGNNRLVGDLSISANGNWVINGVETEFKAQGEAGTTPLIRLGDNNKFQVSYNKGNKWEDISGYIEPTIRMTGASGNSIGHLELSMDKGTTWKNLSGDIVNNLKISKYIGIYDTLPTTGVEEGTIYMKGPYYDENDTNNDNPIYRMWVYAWKDNTLAWVDNGEFTSIIAGVVNDLATGGTDKALSAEMGKELTKSSFNSPKMKEYVYNHGNGALVTTASLSGQCSSKIACLPNRLYYVKNKGLTGVRIIYWDATDTYIGSYTYNEDTNRKESPSNAAYMAVFTDTANTWEHIFIEDISDVDFLHVDFDTDVVTTRKSVPYIFRRIGLVLSYIVDGERVLEVFNTTPGTYLNDYAWAADSAWDKFILNKEYEDQVAETAKVIDLTQKASYSKAEYISPVWTEGYYINDVGSVVADSNFKYSEPISLKGGDKIIVYGRGTVNVAIISLHIDGKYKPVIKGTNSISPEEFIYEANAECEVAVCYLSAWSSYYVARTSNELASKLLAQQPTISKIDANTIRLVKSKNLLDASKSVVGLLRGEGTVSDTMVDYLTSDFIEVEPNTSYTISTSSGKVYCYGEYVNDSIIKYQTPNANLINIITSSLTNKIRIGYVKTATSVQVEKGETATSYEPYDKPTELGTDKEGRPIRVSVEVEDQFIVDRSQNLLILETFTKIGYHKWDGTYLEDDKYRTSNTTIGLEGGKTYSHNLSFVSFKLYDENMEPIGYQYNPTSPFVAKSGAKYAEVSLPQVNLNTLNCILAEGDSIPEGVGEGYFPTITKDRKSGMGVVAKLGDKKPVHKNFWFGKKYASLGDSITYRNQWQRIVDFHLGTKHVNFACSGMTVGGYAFHYTTGGSEEGSQIGTAVADRLLNAQDFADCQLIIVCGYANNAYGNSGNGTVIGSMEDDYKTISEDDISNYSSVNEYRKSITGQTFIAACRSTIEYLQKVAPHARIVVSGQFLMDTSYLPNYDANNIDLHRKNGQGLDTVAYSDAMKEVAEYYSLPYVDLARNGGVNNMNWQLYYPASDQVHPNFASYVGGEDYPDSGMYKMARGIIGVLESI